MSRVRTSRAEEEKRLLLRWTLLYSAPPEPATSTTVPSSSRSSASYCYTSWQKRYSQARTLVSYPFEFCLQNWKLWSGSKHKAGSRSLPHVLSMNYTPCSLQDNLNTVDSNTDWTNAKLTGRAWEGLWNNPALDKNWDWRLLKKNNRGISPK